MKRALPAQSAQRAHRTAFHQVLQPGICTQDPIVTKKNRQAMAGSTKYKTELATTACSYSQNTEGPSAKHMRLQRKAEV